mmetsp:Transcript_13565/g.25859  ORF Transcript_13565/g.25859 Transcript_13565/m.25859 type:complete len:229 (-) Transcript_13565:328-1014(-)
MSVQSDLMTLVMSYASALAPFPFLAVCAARRKTRWIVNVWFATVVMGAIGWEVWWTFGIWEGDPVKQRRQSALLNKYLPQCIEWLVMSLGDGTIGVLAVGLLHARRRKPLRRFHLSDAICVGLFFIVQDILVGTFMFGQQLNTGTISRAPLSPWHPTWNPVMEMMGISFNFEVTWLFMSFIWYPVALTTYSAFRPLDDGEEESSIELGHDDGAAASGPQYVRVVNETV